MNCTFGEAAKGWKVSVSFIKRARSHGLIRVVLMGSRPRIPPDEYKRIVREGLPHIPLGYKRITGGPTKAGRPRKVAKPKAQQRVGLPSGRGDRRQEGAVAIENKPSP